MAGAITISQKSFLRNQRVHLPELAGETVNTLRSTLSPSFLRQLPKIQQVEIYLERKAKAPSTINTYIKALKELAKRADLNNTIETELTSARA
jgi:hypothetical protein